jgi:hypothetical protein
VLLLFSKWANYRYREETEWLHDAQFGYWKLLHDLGLHVRVISEDNLTENLRNYRGIVLAFSPLDLMPADDRERIRKTGLPIIADMFQTPSLRPADAETIAGDFGSMKSIAPLPWASIADLSKLGAGFKFAMKFGNQQLFAYNKHTVVLGFPLGYYYLHGADESQCRTIMKQALEKVLRSKP